MMENIKKIGLIAGGGNLPLSLLDECEKRLITPYVVVLKDFAIEENYKKYIKIDATYGNVGKIISFFKRNDVQYIMFAGSVKKPNIKRIWPDLKGFSLFLQLIRSKLFGDDTIFQIILKFLDKEGFKVLSVNDFSNNLKIKEGIIGTTNMSKKYLIDINLGIKVLKQLGNLDIGQSVVIQNGIVLGIECLEGTEKLIDRCASIKYNTGRKPILVKIKKTTQTKKIDLPAIGKDTIIQLKNANFAGIALDCDNGIIINKEDTIKLANKNKIFINGIKI